MTSGSGEGITALGPKSMFPAEVPAASTQTPAWPWDCGLRPHWLMYTSPPMISSWLPLVTHPLEYSAYGRRTPEFDDPPCTMGLAYHADAKAPGLAVCTPRSLIRLVPTVSVIRTDKVEDGLKALS